MARPAQRADAPQAHIRAADRGAAFSAPGLVAPGSNAVRAGRTRSRLARDTGTVRSALSFASADSGGRPMSAPGPVFLPRRCRWPCFGGVDPSIILPGCRWHSARRGPSSWRMSGRVRAAPSTGWPQRRARDFLPPALWRAPLHREARKPRLAILRCAPALAGAAPFARPVDTPSGPRRARVSRATEERTTTWPTSVPSSRPATNSPAKS